MTDKKETRRPLRRHALQIEMNRLNSGDEPPPFVSKKILFAEIENYLDGNHRDGKPRRPSLKATGYLAIMIKVTKQASISDYPLNAADFRTAGGGQVKT